MPCENCELRGERERDERLAGCKWHEICINQASENGRFQDDQIKRGMSQIKAQTTDRQTVV